MDFTYRLASTETHIAELQITGPYSAINRIIDLTDQDNPVAYEEAVRLPENASYGLEPHEVAQLRPAATAQLEALSIPGS